MVIPHILCCIPIEHIHASLLPPPRDSLLPRRRGEPCRKGKTKNALPGHEHLTDVAREADGLRAATNFPTFPAAKLSSTPSGHSSATQNPLLQRSSTRLAPSLGPMDTVGRRHHLSPDTSSPVPQSPHATAVGRPPAPAPYLAHRTTLDVFSLAYTYTTAQRHLWFQSQARNHLPGSVKTIRPVEQPAARLRARTSLDVLPTGVP